jgi:hypothetical protein
MDEENRQTIDRTKLKIFDELVRILMEKKNMSRD